MKYGSFRNGGKEFVINTPLTPSAWTNPVFSDEFLCELSQTLCGRDGKMEGYQFSQLSLGMRNFYVKSESGEHKLLYGCGNSFECVHRIESTTINEVFDDFSSSVRVFVPKKGEREILTFKLKNTGTTEKKYSVFFAMTFGGTSPMGGECNFDKENKYFYRYSFPYHITYEQKKLVESSTTYSYVISDTEVASFDGSANRFFGAPDYSVMPRAVTDGKCSCLKGVADDCICAESFDLTVLPGQEKEINIIAGFAYSKDEIKLIKDNFPDVDAEYNNVCDLWQKRFDAFYINTPNKELNYLVNYWLKKQIVYLTRLNRISTVCPVRNQLQDALGYAMIDADDALNYAIDIIKTQDINGHIKQWHKTDGTQGWGLCRLNHSDAPIWLIMCVIEIIEKTGKKENYDRLVGYADSDKEESILTHLKKAAEFMLTQKGEHGLILMLDGDWTDPVNGPGRGGKGESTWNTAAFLYALNMLLEISPDDELKKQTQLLKSAVNEHCWDGKWYVAGFDDNGIPFGKQSDKEGRIFLNSQTWSIISGICEGDRLNTLVQSIDTLKTPFGYRLLWPPFSDWNDTWGRISVKKSGTTENASVYCHASMFKALADITRGDYNAAVEAILDTLPTNPKNPPSVNTQLPLFVSNYYYGLEDGNFGISSCHYSTGTSPWLVWLVVEHIFGSRKTVDGIKLIPHLPAGWENATLKRK